MILTLTLLAASPLILDQPQSLNATQRADLDVASEGRVVVALIDTGKALYLNERAEALAQSNPGKAVVVFDRTLDRGAVRLPIPVDDPHEAALLQAELDRLANGQLPSHSRLVHTVGFLSRISVPIGHEEPRRGRSLEQAVDELKQVLLLLGGLVVGVGWLILQVHPRFAAYRCLCRW